MGDLKSIAASAANMTDNKPKIKKPLYKRILRVFFISISVLLLLLIILVLLIQTEPVQNFLRGKAVSYLEGKLHTKVQVGKLHIGFPKNVIIENVFFEDRQHDTLFSAGKLAVNISMLKLFRSEVEVNSIELEHAVVKIQRQLPGSTFNFQFIIDAFSSPVEKPASKNDSSTSKISIKDISLDHIRAIYADVSTGNDVELVLKHLDVHISKLDLKNQYFEIPEINVDGLHGKIYQNEPLSVTAVAETSPANASLPKFEFRDITLKNAGFDYRNNPAALFALVGIGNLVIDAKEFDMEKKIIALNELKLSGTTASVRLGKSVSKKKNPGNTIAKPADSPGWLVRVKNILLDKNNIAFDDDNAPRQKKGMDYSHIKSSGISLYAGNFLYSQDLIAGNITKGKLAEQSGFKLEALQGDFSYAGKQAYIKNLKLQTPGTLLQRSMVLNYPSLDTLKKNIKLLVLDIDMRNCKIQVKDLLTFVPSLDTMASMKNPNAVFLMNARIRGTIDDLKIDQFQFAGLQNTRIDANGYVKGWPDLKLMHTNLFIKNISSSKNDLLSFIPANKLPSAIAIPGKFDINGQMKGNMQNLFTYLNLHSGSGKATIKGYLKNLDDIKNIGYDAALTTDNLDLGHILKDDSTYGKLTMRVKASGRGTDLKTAHSNIEGEIESADFKKYHYRHAAIKASIADHIAKADIDIRDSNISLSLNAFADFSSNFPAIKISSLIDRIKTRPLHFTVDDIAYRGRIDADFPLSNPDSLEGELFIENSVLERNGEKVSIDTIRLSAGQTDTGQYLRLYADVIDAELRGKYKLTEMGNVFQQLTEPYFSAQENDKAKNLQPYHFSIFANVHHGATIKKLLPSLERLDPIGFQGQFDSEKGWSADLNSPLIIYADSRIQNFGFHVKPAPKALNMQTSLQQYSSGKSFSIYNTSFDASFENNKIDFVLNVQDKSSKDQYHLDGLVQNTDSGVYRFSLKPENILLNYEKWDIASDNNIQYSTSKIIAHHFDVSKASEKLNISSSNDENNSPVEISFNNFLLATLTAFAGTDSLFANGELNGKIIVKNILSKPTFTGDLKIKDLDIYKDTVGDIALKVSSTEENKFSASAGITGHGNDVVLNGDYYVRPGGNSNFNFDLDIRNLELASVVGVSNGTLKTASGSLNGKLIFKGTIGKPDIEGNIAFNKAALVPSMLNSYFFIDGQKFEVGNEGFHFDKFTILDSAKNKLVFDGNIRTSDYKHYNFDLSINAANFQALNNSKRDNQLYYGKLFFNTNLNVKGTELKPVIDGTLRINNKTKLTIVMPQNEPGVQEREGIVRFVDLRSAQPDSVLNAGYDSIGKSFLRGFNISTNIIVDSSAELTLIVDPANGDHLLAKGNATLTGGVDPGGNINLSGTYQLTRGSYDFTFSLLHKKFEIQKGSTISWTGEPTKGNLDIDAVCTINAAPIDLVNDQVGTTANRNNFLQKIPFDAHLKMRGELLKPEITFDIVLPDEKTYSVSKDVINTVQSKLQLIRQDQGEMSKQVFALLLLGRFVGDDPFASSTTSAYNPQSMARASVSGILSQQLNNLAANLVHGVDINFDIKSTDDYTTGQLQNRTDLNVSVSKQLLNDRLRVTVGSNFEIEGPQNVNANQQSNNIAGNIALDYKLSKDGRYLLRAYHKTDNDDVIEGYVIETGIGFIITVDYNQFKEIFRSKKKTKDSNSSNKDGQGILPGDKND